MDTKGKASGKAARKAPPQPLQGRPEDKPGATLPQPQNPAQSAPDSSTTQTAEITATTLSNRSEQLMANNATPSTIAELVRQVHYILQGKGGVGKSLIASVIAQYIKGKDRPLVVYDTDPVNATLAGYKALDTQRLELMRDGSLVERNFDRLIEQIVEQDSDFVVDNGAASFIPLSYYLAENDAINLIAENGKQVYIHTVITGGQALRDTLGGFASLCEQMPGDARLVVWLNEFFGDIEAEGKTFEEMKVYQANKDRVHGIVRIARQTGSTYGEDVKLMLDSKLTFDEIQQSADFGLMSKSRLNKVKSSIFQQLDTII
ncbi:conjugal transfer protein TraL [Salmonella enterica]|nr:conjugal transfer protein TraL [Salmonella enterica]